MMPAVFVAASITDNQTVLAAGIVERGFPNTFGKIEFEADGRWRARSSATIKARCSR